jgi:hypothetical protein
MNHMNKIKVGMRELTVAVDELKLDKDRWKTRIRELMDEVERNRGTDEK